MKKTISIDDISSLKGKFVMDESSANNDVLFVYQTVNDSWVCVIGVKYPPTSRSTIDGYKLVEHYRALDDQEGLELFKKKNRGLDLTELMNEYEAAGKAIEFMETYGLIIESEHCV